MASWLMPVPRPVCSRAAQTAPIEACEVMPDMESIATSTISAPAAAQAIMLDTLIPAVS